jgi:hypothetical protein
MKQLIKAVLSVMDECKGIEKSLNVGTGNSFYKGVSDKDVKIKIGQSMHRHGLIILPTGVKPNTTINSWEEETNYGKKMKQNVFTEVITEYLLAHESGESTTLVGFGHGADPQDKAAGKATTYALKYTLLYSFLVATGHIDDTDNTHSDDLPTPVKPAKQAQTTATTPSATAPKKVAETPANAANSGKSDAMLAELRVIANSLKGEQKSALVKAVMAATNDAELQKLKQQYAPAE